MILRNKSTNSVIASDLKVASSAADKLLGLLKKKNPRSLLFYTRFGIHTLFLKSPIDVIVTNSNLEVKKAKTVTPNSFLIYNPAYACVIELPQGTIKKSKTKIGDKLTISD